MNARIYLGVCASLVLLGSAGAADINESAVESTTSVIHLPDSVPQTVTVRSCAACAPKELQATQDTQYFIGKTAVTLEELRRSAATTNTNVYVFYDAREHVITRIKLDAPYDPAVSGSTAPSIKRRGN